MTLAVKTFATVGEAAAAITSTTAARFLGGGTLVMRAVNEGEQAFDTIVRTTDPDLTQIQAAGERVTIGAGVTMSGVLAHAELDFLHAAARSVGGPAVRNMATVGGNLFAPHPYGDFATALLALGATVTLANGQSQDLDAVLQARGGTTALVQSVTVARPKTGDFKFKKVSRIKPKGAAVMTIAAYLPVQLGGTISGARVAYGAMGAVPMRVAAVEQALEGQRLDAAGITNALSVATQGLEPPTDALASSWYRREVAPVYLKRLLLGR